MTHDPRLAKIGENVRDAREEARLSQRAAASAIGTNQSLIWQIETGRISTGLETLLKLADLYEVAPGIFFSGVEGASSGTSPDNP